MIQIVKTLSLTGISLLTAISLLTTGCNREETDQIYTEKALEANAKLKQEISRLKQDIREADDSTPDKLEETVAQLEKKLQDIRNEEKSILTDCVTLCEEWDKCNFKRAQLNAALEELTSIFNNEIEDARKQKNKLSRDNEYFNQ